MTGYWGLLAVSYKEDTLIKHLLTVVLAASRFLRSPIVRMEDWLVCKHSLHYYLSCGKSALQNSFHFHEVSISELCNTFIHFTTTTAQWWIFPCNQNSNKESFGGSPYNSWDQFHITTPSDLQQPFAKCLGSTYFIHPMLASWSLSGI